MWKLLFKKNAQKELEKLDIGIQKRIKNKLLFYIKHEDPLYFAEKLTGFPYGEYRFRVGDYRIIFDVDSQGKIIIIAVIGHRKEIYK